MYQIVDKIDSRFPEESIVKTNFIKELILVQHTEEENTLLGMFLLKDDKVVLINSGNMNFNSTHGGMNVLRDFRRWLDQNNIHKRTLKFTEVNTYEEIFLQSNVKKEIFIEDGNDNVKNQFYNWANGEDSW